MPRMGHPMITKKKPTPNEIVPLKFCLFIKNCRVDFGPIVKETPERKRIFPIASSPLSKKKTIPRNEKKIPNPVKPSPIFLRSFISNETIATASGGAPVPKQQARLIQSRWNQSGRRSRGGEPYTGTQQQKKTEKRKKRRRRRSAEKTKGNGDEGDEGRVSRGCLSSDFDMLQAYTGRSKYAMETLVHPLYACIYTCKK